jgi:hypothetical protein
MTADECHDRASACAANAAAADSPALVQEFMKLAAQWRAMATGEIFLGSIDAFFDPSDSADDPIMLPG